ncbi:alpha/beta hydrolase [Paenarthrobacter sp. DKR-5]|uniref:alpha/beta fold hydrolase n=1 Tax=Paenarthrobacter sp. DKR-5 TaxID=2835535 RepID=UPI001BDC27A4|nr:alpha/beta hydrolase [Paenarthrobacter sp. DKR-5]MBT1004457.1 alpha/beta hydrolase [Paenarthrobacter sp. DKR-5]
MPLRRNRQPQPGPLPQEFGSAVFDQAARLDAELPDLDWTVLPDGARRLDLRVPSGTLAAVAMGNAEDPPVLLVPGATGSKEDFSLMLPELAAAGYYVLSFDLAGQYESSGAGPENLTPPAPRYDYELFIGDLLAVLAACTAPAHVVGYSFAAVVAQLAWARRPDLFASLTLLSCPPEPGQSFRGIRRIGRLTPYANGRVGAALMIWGIRRNLVPVPPGRLRFVRQRFLRTRRQSVRDIFELMQRAPDLRPLLAAAPLPKLVAVGEHDLWPLALHAEFARVIGAKLAVYRAGHSPCETSPHQLCRDLLALFRNPA